MLKSMRLRLVLAGALALPLAPATSLTAVAQSRCGDVWRVSPGDTLSTISRACGVPAGTIQAANPQIDWRRLQVGARVNLVGGGRPPSGGQARPEAYIVRPGDTLSSIARSFGIPLQALLAANPGLSDRDLQVGREIVFGRPGGGGPRPPVDRPSGPSGGDFVYRDFGYRIDDRGAVPGGEVRIGVEGVRPGERISVFAAAQRGRDRAETSGRADRRGRVDLLFAIPGRAGPGGWTIEIESERGRVLDAGGFEIRGGRPGNPGTPDRLRVIGTLSNEGATCPTLRGEDGRLYSLAGDLGGYRGGDRVEVSGSFAQMSNCMQGITIAVSSIRAAR